MSQPAPIPFNPKQKRTPEERETQLKRLYRLGFALGWKLPFFMPAFSRIEIKVEEDDGLGAKTANVRADGRITINTNLAIHATDAEIKALLAHEMLHLLLDHFQRRDARKRREWNIATDMAINHAIEEANIALGGKELLLPSWVYRPPREHVKESAEGLYRLILEGKIPVSPESEYVLIGAGCGLEEDELPPEIARQWAEVGAQCRSFGAGKAGCKHLVDISQFPASKTKWKNMVLHSCQLASAMHGRDYQSWRKRSRRSQPVGPQFAGWLSAKPNIAILMDTSGSMSNEAMARACAEGAVLGKFAANIFFVVHDAEVHFAGWLGAEPPPVKFQRKLNGGGGTSFSEAYQVVEENGPFDIMLHATDGIVGLWPAKPRNVRQLIVALLANKAENISPPPETRVVEVQL